MVVLVPDAAKHDLTTTRKHAVTLDARRERERIYKGLRDDGFAKVDDYGLTKEELKQLEDAYWHGLKYDGKGTALSGGVIWKNTQKVPLASALINKLLYAPSGLQL